MRILDEKFEDMFKNEFKGIIEYVKKHDEVFLGIRHNYINLYVDGGSFLKLKYNTVLNCCTGEIDEKYFNHIEMPKGLKDINKKVIENIQDWIDLFDELIIAVRKYQRGEFEGKASKTIKREKILQQELVKEFNLKSDYFAYDIEYSMEGVNDYILDADGAEIKINNKYRTKALGRADIMLIGKPINNKIKIYCMEVKEGKGAFGGVLPNKSKQKSAPSFGSGIVGHLKNNVAIINSARSGKDLIAKKGKSRYPIRENLMKEIKYALSFYKKFNLLKNDNFKELTQEEINKLELSKKDNSVELVFFLGNYEKDSFEKYLGIGLDSKICSAYSVKNLLNNKMKNEIDLDYLKIDDLFDFKVFKTSKNYSDNNFDLNIEKYDSITVEDFK